MSKSLDGVLALSHELLLIRVHLAKTRASDRLFLFALIKDGPELHARPR